MMLVTYALFAGPLFGIALGTCPNCEAEEAALLQVRAGDDLGKTPESGWYSFIKGVLEACKNELGTEKNANIYQAMQKLERLDKLSSKCKDAAFKGTAAEPNPKLFRIIAQNPNPSDEDIEMKDYVIGELEAPLIYEQQEMGDGPVHRTFFGMNPCRKQPAPQGMIFVHNGGPAPGLLDAKFWKDIEDYEYVRENYDVVSVDQRGMGVSGLIAFTDFQQWMDAGWPQSYGYSHGGMIWAISQDVSKTYKGTMVGGISSVNDKNFNGPCTEYAEKLGDFLQPSDWSNSTEVEDFLGKKMLHSRNCFKLLDRTGQDGRKYNLLQYMGTQALVHDIEWLRWAFGSPKISLVGQSYGTRVAAAYSSQFPASVRRFGVTGIMGPIPDLLQYAQGSAANSAEMLGFVQSSCAADEGCMQNPFQPGEMEERKELYFRGDTDTAINELFRRSSHGGAWYTATHSGMCKETLTMSDMTRALQGFMGTAQLHGTQNSTWPTAFGAMRSLVFFMLQNPCKAVQLYRFQGYGWEYISVYNNMPALDMTGRWSKNQVTAFITQFAQDTTLSPALNMFLLYALAAYSPLLPHPIEFTNSEVEGLIAQPLYDDRTGMNFAQQFKLNFPKSRLIKSMSGGHCVAMDHGPEAFGMFVDYVLYGTPAQDGALTGKTIPIDFREGHERFLDYLKTKIGS